MADKVRPRLSLQERAAPRPPAPRRAADAAPPLTPAAPLSRPLLWLSAPLRRRAGRVPRGHRRPRRLARAKLQRPLRGARVGALLPRGSRSTRLLLCAPTEGDVFFPALERRPLTCLLPRAQVAAHNEVPEEGEWEYHIRKNANDGKGDAVRTQREDFRAGVGQDEKALLALAARGPFDGRRGDRAAPAPFTRRAARLLISIANQGASIARRGACGRGEPQRGGRLSPRRLDCPRR